jgi:hypothetical protein
VIGRRRPLRSGRRLALAPERLHPRVLREVDASGLADLLCFLYAPVKGSSALKCETKIVREYLRVSCKGKRHGI